MNKYKGSDTFQRYYENGSKRDFVDVTFFDNTEFIVNLDHKVEYHAAKEPTCTDIGWYAYETCSHCGLNTYVERPALGHSLEHHAAKSPTCTDIGWYEYENCSRSDRR
jgi:hypothetical protein